MIAIKDIKMPVNCEECFARMLAWCRLDEEERMVIPALPDVSFEGRPEWCPLVDVPDMNVGNCSEIPNNSDCVSRRAAIDALLELVEARRTWISTEDARKEISGIDASMCAIHDLPSVQPEWKKGEWIHKPDIYLDEQTWECSECGEPWIFIEGTPSENNANFCPNCGADMRGDFTEMMIPIDAIHFDEERTPVVELVENEDE